MRGEEETEGGGDGRFEAKMGESHTAKMVGKVMLLMHSAYESGCMCNYRL